MKLQRHFLITLICLIYPAFGLFSQENSEPGKDSLWNDVQAKIGLLERQRVQDSLKIDILSQELQHLIMLRGDFDNAENNQSKVNQDSVLNKQKLDYIEKIRSKTEGVPVVLENDTLFRILPH